MFWTGRRRGLHHADVLARLRSLDRVRVGRVVVLVAVAVLAVLWFTTDLLRPSRTVVARALTNLARPSDLELRFLVDIRADQGRLRSGEYHHLSFRAGPGPYLRPENARVQIQFPFTLLLERRGLALHFTGQTIVRDGAGYVQLTELPPFKQLAKVLEGRWLQVSDRQEGPGRAVQPAEARVASRRLLARDLTASVTREGTASIRGVRARAYRLTFHEDALREFLRGLPASVPDHPGVSLVARYLDARLQEYRVDRAVLWVRPRAHTIVRARLELVPREEGKPIQRVIVDATILPRQRPGTGTGPDVVGGVPEAPARGVRLRPETLRLLLPR